MNIILIILGVIAGIVAILLIAALFTKKEYDVAREVTINGAKQNVFDFLKHLKNQEYYSKWVMMDPNAKKEYQGKDGTVGFVSAWDSQNKNAGKGEQEITGIKDGERIDIQLRFERPFKGISESYIVTENAGAGKTKVKWGFSSSMKYPMNILLLFINLPELLGRDMETSLSNLKNLLESRANTESKIDSNESNYEISRHN